MIITHAAFRFIPVPAAFEREMIAGADRLPARTSWSRADDDDRITRKRLEAMKEKLGERLEALKSRRDDMVTLEEIGIDQIIVDEAQEFRKLSLRHQPGQPEGRRSGRLAAGLGPVRESRATSTASGPAAR